MALTFSVVAIAAAFGGHWVVRLDQGGRFVAMLVFPVLGITLLFPSLAEVFTLPLVRAGGPPRKAASENRSFSAYRRDCLGLHVQALSWA
jgi:hypothetical protein